MLREGVFHVSPISCFIDFPSSQEVSDREQFFPIVLPGLLGTR